jgi:ubiquinone biosynthesis protein UbiJ
VTAAGLFELCGPQVSGVAPPAADLSVRVVLPGPHLLALQWLGGQRPTVTVDGDAELAADVAWLGDNLRWDVAQDLARIVGAGPAQLLSSLATRLAAGLRDLALRASGGWGGGTPPAASR